MDAKLNKVNYLIVKNKDKCVNIVSLWETYFKDKVERLNKELDNFIELFGDEKNKIEKDLDLNTIMLLYILSNN